MRDERLEMMKRITKLSFSIPFNPPPPRFALVPPVSGGQFGWRSALVTDSTPRIGVVPRRGEGVERGRGSKRMEEELERTEMYCPTLPPLQGG